jgi:hypothetical protein
VNVKCFLCPWKECVLCCCLMECSAYVSMSI